MGTGDRSETSIIRITITKWEKICISTKIAQDKEEDRQTRRKRQIPKLGCQPMLTGNVTERLSSNSGVKYASASVLFKMYNGGMT